MGGVASTALIEELDRFSHYLVNPIVHCSIHDKLINQKLKHLMGPLDPESLDSFPSLFQQDLAKSNVRADNVRKAIFVVGDPAMAVCSLYRRGLEVDHAQNLSQKKEVKIPSDLDAFVALNKDVFNFKTQLNEWLKGSKYYDIMILKHEALFSETERIAEFSGCNVEDLKKNLKLKKRQTKTDANYNELAEGVYADLIKEINQLPEIQIVKKHA